MLEPYIYNVMTDQAPVTHPAIRGRSISTTRALQALHISPCSPEQLYTIFRGIYDDIKVDALERKFQHDVVHAPVKPEYAEYMQHHTHVPAGTTAAVSGVPEWCHYQLVRFLTDSGIQVVIPYPATEHGVVRLHPVSNTV